MRGHNLAWALSRPVRVPTAALWQSAFGGVRGENEWVLCLRRRSVCRRHAVVLVSRAALFLRLARCRGDIVGASWESADILGCRNAYERAPENMFKCVREDRLFWSGEMERRKVTSAKSRLLPKLRLELARVFSVGLCTSGKTNFGFASCPSKNKILW